MICQLRRRAGSVIVGIALVISTTAFAQAASEAVTRMEMWKAIVSTVGGGVLLGAGLLAWILSRDREQTRDGVQLLVKSNEAIASRIAESLSALANHDVNPHAHRAASEHNHDPMNEKMEAIEKKLDQLLMEHRVIRGSEDEVCALVRGMARRNPADSPKPKRSTDSKDDYTALRGTGGRSGSDE